MTFLFDRRQFNHVSAEALFHGAVILLYAMRDVQRQN